MLLTIRVSPFTRGWPAGGLTRADPRPPPARCQSRPAPATTAQPWCRARPLRRRGGSPAFGIVLVCPRVAEISEHPVPHVLGDKPAAALDHSGAAAVIGADDRAQIFRVEPGRREV